MCKLQSVLIVLLLLLLLLLLLSYITLLEDPILPHREHSFPVRKISRLLL